MWVVWTIIIGFVMAWMKVHTVYGPLRRVPAKQVHPPFRFNDQPAFLRVIQCAFWGYATTIVVWAFIR